MSQGVTKASGISPWRRVGTLLGIDCPDQLTYQITPLLLTNYPEIRRLVSSLSIVEGESISFETCEMLDAELKNQGIKSPPATLTQLFQQETALLRWRARRSSAKLPRLNFELNVRQYLCVSAFEVSSILMNESLKQQDPSLSEEVQISRKIISWSSILPTNKDCLREMSYFESLAKFLNEKGSGGDRSNQLVLQMIVQGRRDDAPQSIVLPTSAAEFLAQIR